MDDSGGSLDVTVAVCTRDRPDRLQAFLQSAAQLNVPDDLRWELLIIDNGGDGRCEPVVARFASLLPIRRVAAPVPGLSHARNRAVADTRGRYLCWADDDVLLDPGWLEAYVHAFLRHPNAALFGGPIRPALEAPVPAWVRATLNSSYLRFAFAQREASSIAPIEASRDAVPWGANFAVRAAEQRRLSYDPQLGLSPSFDRLGEECDVAFRMLEQGESGWWVPEAGVRHVISRERQSHGYVRSYFEKMARTAVFLDGAPERPSRAELLLRIGAYRALLLASILLKLPGLRVMCLARIGYCTGLLSASSAQQPRAAAARLAASQ